MITGFPCLLATELPVSKREREKESKRDPHPRQRAPHFLGSCQALPSFPAGPHPFLTTPNAPPRCPGGVRAEGSPGLSPALPKEQSPATLACDWHPHASLEGGGSLMEKETETGPDWPVDHGCSAEKGQRCSTNVKWSFTDVTRILEWSFN